MIAAVGPVRCGRGWATAGWILVEPFPRPVPEMARHSSLAGLRTLHIDLVVKNFGWLVRRLPSYQCPLGRMMKQSCPPLLVSTCCLRLTLLALLTVCEGCLGLAGSPYFWMDLMLARMIPCRPNYIPCAQPQPQPPLQLCDPGLEVWRQRTEHGPENSKKYASFA